MPVAKPQPRRKKKEAPKPAFVRRTITIPRDLDELAHEKIDEREFSALATVGIRRELRHRGMLKLIAEYEAEHGLITLAEMNAAREKIDAAFREVGR